MAPERTLPVTSPCPLPDVSMRPARASDLPAMLALERVNMKPWIDKYYPGCWDDKQAFGSLESNLDEASVIEVGGKLVGFYAGWTEEELAVLHTIQVDAAHRSRGLGAWMVECFLAEAWARGLRKVEVAVHEGNPARRLYERLGFKVVAKDGPHAWQMLRDLSPADAASA